jgi:hypothetical protein
MSRPDVVAAPAALERALQLTAAMLAAGRAQEWDRLTALEAERAPLVLRQHPQDAATRVQLGELLAGDRELRVLVSQARDTAAGQWQRENERARAIRAYAQK